MRCPGGLRRAFDECKRELLAVESHKALLSDPHTQMLQAKLRLRTPYITPLNILQVPAPPLLPLASASFSQRWCAATACGHSCSSTHGRGKACRSHMKR